VFGSIRQQPEKPNNPQCKLLGAIAKLFWLELMGFQFPNSQFPNQANTGSLSTVPAFSNGHGLPSK
jgi:hypothetical protein